MSNSAESVDFDASKDVKNRVHKGPSDVMLALILEHVKAFDSPYYEFEALMETWNRVRELETLAEPLDFKTLYYDLIDKLLDQDARPAPDPKEVQIDQHTFVSESDAEAVKSARASGCTLQGIADQSSLSLAKVLDLINGEPCPVTDWTKLEKGLKKLGHPPRVIPKEETHEQEEE